MLLKELDVMKELDQRTERSERNSSPERATNHRLVDEVNASIRSGERQQSHRQGQDASLPNLEIVSNNESRRGFNAEFAADGSMNAFTDNRGARYTRDGDHFVDRNNPVRTGGVDIRIDQATNSAIITDRASRIATTLGADGLETVDYSASGGGRTTRRVTDTNEYISIESTNRPLRMLILERNAQGARVSQYSDSRMNTYTVSNRMDADGHPLYEAVASDGRVLGQNFSVTADRSGNVVVRNQDTPNAADYAVREYNNGTIVTSNRDNTMRTVTDASGRQLAPDSDEARRAQESPMLQDVPPSANMYEALREAQENFVGSGIFTSVPGMQWFHDRVTNNGAWDFKRAGDGNNVTNLEYEDYANWNYGYVGTAAGIDGDFLQQQAGANQRNSGTSRPEWGAPSTGFGLFPEGWSGIGGSGTYGDDPRDNRWIREGIANRTRDVQRQWEESSRLMAS